MIGGPESQCLAKVGARLLGITHQEIDPADLSQEGGLGLLVTRTPPELQGLCVQRERLATTAEGGGKDPLVVKIACTMDRPAMSLNKTAAASCAGMFLVILLSTGITIPG